MDAAAGRSLPRAAIRILKDLHNRLAESSFACLVSPVENVGDALMLQLQPSMWFILLVHVPLRRDIPAVILTEQKPLFSPVRGS